MNKKFSGEFSASMVGEFWNRWGAGDYKGQRVGQAFFNHFGLHKMSNPPHIIYEMDDVREFKAWLRGHTSEN